MKTYAWESSWFCIKCDEELDYDEKYHSNGVCPYCGEDSSPLFVVTKTKVRRWVETSPPRFWAFWLSDSGSEGHWEYKE